MSILTQYRAKLHLKDVERERKQINGRKSTKNFTGLQTVGILLDATNVETADKVLAFIKKLEKEAGSINILGYADVKELKEAFSFNCFCKKDLDWLWKPKSTLTDQFKQQQFDLLINCCQTDCFPLEYLATSIQANYKIGALTDYPNDYDLMLESKNLENYFKQVNFFLDKFSNKV